MTKYKKIYHILKATIDIPINDLDAWKKYPQYNFLYNKINICEYQNIKHAPMPIEPENYPVIIKPIINIYGMGLNVIKINSSDEFYEQWHNNNFWMEYLEGDHLSYDLIILKGDIQYHTCFRGEKDKDNLGEFHYWESINKGIPEIVKKLVKEKLVDYTGCFNVETINDVIIEVHLRMGDIDAFPTFDILKGIIETYNGNKYNWNNIILDPVYFFPLWMDADDTSHKKIKHYIEKNIEPILKKNQYVHEYHIDSTTLARPNGNRRRIMSFCCSYKEYGVLLLKNLRERLLNDCYE